VFKNINIFQTNEINCGVQDVDRILNEYETLVNLEQTFAPYLGHNGYPLDLDGIPPELWPDALGYHVTYFGIDMRAALSCIAGDGSRSAGLLRLISVVQSDIRKRISLTNRLINAKRDAIEAAEEAREAAANATANAQSAVSSYRAPSLTPSLTSPGQSAIALSQTFISPSQASSQPFNSATYQPFVTPPVSGPAEDFTAAQVYSNSASAQPRQDYFWQNPWYISNLASENYGVHIERHNIHEHHLVKRDMRILESGIANVTLARKHLSLEAISKILANKVFLSSI
jgi:hypothetical protein